MTVMGKRPLPPFNVHIYRLWMLRHFFGYLGVCVPSRFHKLRRMPSLPPRPPAHPRAAFWHWLSGRGGGGGPFRAPHLWTPFDSFRTPMNRVVSPSEPVAYTHRSTPENGPIPVRRNGCAVQTTVSTPFFGGSVTHLARTPKRAPKSTESGIRTLRNARFPPTPAVTKRSRLRTR